MKFIFLILFINSLIFSQLINVVKLPIRPIYISRHIEQDHVTAIHWAMSEYNRYSELWNSEMLLETNDKSMNHIRIEYSDYNGCSMSAVSHTEGYFMVSETSIAFDQSLDPIMTQCIILHELGHALGLGHTSDEIESIMHKTVSLQTAACTLKKTDLINLYNGHY